MAMAGTTGMCIACTINDFLQVLWLFPSGWFIFTAKFKKTMKNLFIAFLLTAFVGSGYIATATPVSVVVSKDDDKEKKDKKSCEKKSSCCKMKAGEAKACAGMAKAEAAAEGTASAVASPAAPAAEAKPACAGEKKACCKKKASCSDKEKSSSGVIN